MSNLVLQPGGKTWYRDSPSHPFCCLSLTNPPSYLSIPLFFPLFLSYLSLFSVGISMPLVAGLPLKYRSASLSLFSLLIEAKTQFTVPLEAWSALPAKQKRKTTGAKRAQLLYSSLTLFHSFLLFFLIYKHTYVLGSLFWLSLMMKCLYFNPKSPPPPAERK